VRVEDGYQKLSAGTPPQNSVSLVGWSVAGQTADDVRIVVHAAPGVTVRPNN
jgi:hypothetical protein